MAVGGLIAIFALFTSLWLVSTRLRDASIVDIFWGPAFLTATLAYAAAIGSLTARGALILLIVGIWAFRLGVHIFIRNRGNGEDPRYVAFRKQAGASFWWVSYFSARPSSGGATSRSRRVPAGGGRSLLRCS